MRSPTRTVCLVFILSICFCYGTLVPAWASQAHIIYVAQNGKDAWSGTLPEARADGSDGPVATLQAAVKAARKFGTAGQRRIVVRRGRYFLDRPIVLGVRDTGLTIEAEEVGKAVVCGGRRLAGWQPDGDRYWAIDLPEVAAKKWDFRALMVNDRFSPRSRLPRHGYFTHLNHYDKWAISENGQVKKPSHEALTTMNYQAGDLGPWLDLNNAEIRIYHSYETSPVGLVSIDDKSHTVRFSNPCLYPPGSLSTQRYLVFNTREGMTSPGQWYLDRTAGRVVYWPLPSEEMSRTDVIAPTIESIFRIEGSKKQSAKNITIKGLTLTTTNSPGIPAGFGAHHLSGAVSMRWTDDCCLENLTIFNVAGHGVKATTSNGLHVENCVFRDMGGSGLIFMGNRSVVRNNHVHRVGLLDPAAIGILCGTTYPTMSKDIEISYNEIHEMPYSGIACTGQGPQIRHNLIYNVMQEMVDGGGIYVSHGDRVIVEQNFVRDIPDAVDREPYPRSAFYFDVATQGSSIENNVVLRVCLGVYIHIAQENMIRNNVFISDGVTKIAFHKSADQVFENNVISAKNGVVFFNPVVTHMRRNVLFTAAGQVMDVSTKKYIAVEERPLVLGEDCLLADPRLSRYADGKILFDADSPAIGLGIGPVDVSAAGRM